MIGRRDTLRDRLGGKISIEPGVIAAGQKTDVAEPRGAGRGNRLDAPFAIVADKHQRAIGRNLTQPAGDRKRRNVQGSRHPATEVVKGKPNIDDLDANMCVDKAMQR